MKSIDRRSFLKLTGSSLIGLTIGGTALRANASSGLEPLDEANPAAQALKYVPESVKDGQNCENCMYAKESGDKEWVPCAIFPTNVVSANGWCSAWMAKS